MKNQNFKNFDWNEAERKKMLHSGHLYLKVLHWRLFRALRALFRGESLEESMYQYHHASNIMFRVKSDTLQWFRKYHLPEGRKEARSDA